MKKFLKELDLNIMFVIFLIVFCAELMDFFPGLHGKIWAQRWCGLLILMSVLVTARRSIFITMNSFLHKKLKIVSNIFMILTYIFIETVLFFGLKAFVEFAMPSETYYWLGVLHFSSLVIYPLSLIALLCNIFWAGKDD